MFNESTAQFWFPIIFNLIAYIIGGGIAVLTVTIRVTWQLAQHEKKLRDEFLTLLSVSGKDQDSKTSRVYQRLDETKRWFEDKINGEYVRKDMCNAMHNSTANAVTELKLEVRSDIKELKSEFDKLRDIILERNKE